MYYRINFNLKILYKSRKNSFKYIHIYLGNIIIILTPDIDLLYISSEFSWMIILAVTTWLITR